MLQIHLIKAWKDLFKKELQSVLHQEGYHSRLSKKKMVVQEGNRKNHVEWCKEWKIGKSLGTK